MVQDRDRDEPTASLRTLWARLRPHRRVLLVVVVLSVVGAGLALVQPLLVRSILDRTATGGPLLGIGLLVAGAAVVDGLLRGVRRYLLQRTGEQVVQELRTDLADRLVRLPVAEYDRRRVGDLVSRVGADTTLLRTVVGSGVVELTGGAVAGTGAIVAMVIVDPLLFGVTFGALAVGMTVNIAAVRRVRALSREAQERVGDLAAAVERVLRAVRTVRAARAEDRESAGMAAAAAGAADAGIRVARVEALLTPVTTIAVQGTFLAVLGLGGARVASGALDIGDLVAFVFYLFLLVSPIGNAVQATAQVQAALGALERVEQLLVVDPEGIDDPTDAPEPVPGAPALQLDRVGFTHVDGTRVLSDVSFTVPVGTTTALVGPSGAGKSTLLSLVERFHDVDEGTLSVLGHDVRGWPRPDLRARITYVEQESPVLAGTIADNLRLARPDASDEELLDVLRAVRLEGLVDRASAGLDAQVGDGGMLLSGGERQRLAIARALLADTELLLLDEPTANLDARNEESLRRAVDTARTGRTLVVVAHRLSTVADADQLVVLDEGRVVATGTHAQLLEDSPLYAELAATQLLT
jgi:ATP-binding cassette subfamily B protein/ATP-binding cassette subfamily C protein